MASVRITRTWPDGESVEVQVWAENAYAEAVAVARENALTALRQAIRDAMEDAPVLPSEDE